jgi:hypothetical protein
MSVVPIETKKKPAAVQDPRHLRPTTLAWFRQVLTDWELEQHHVRLLLAAAEALDRAQEARDILEKQGLTFNDRFGAPHARPEVKIERDARNVFMRTIRELDLDTAPPPPPSGRRPPSLRSNRRGA